MVSKGYSMAAILWLALLVVFLVFHFNLLYKLRFYSENSHLVATWTTSPEIFQKLGSKSISERDAMIKCTRSHKYYDYCFIDGPVVLDPTTSTFFTADPTGPTLVEKIKPYPRKFENSTMSRIKELTLISGPPGPKCQVQHTGPALVFSAGGYTGNVFHDFNDGFIPIFIVVHSILHDQAPIIVISEARDRWVSRYADLLKIFSKHPIINLDNDTATHCFTSASVGLISHGLVTINPTLLHNPKTMVHFHEILDKAFGKHRRDSKPWTSRPRLVLLSRTLGVGRAILNQDDARRAAEKVGFELVIFEPTSTTDMHFAYDLISKSHAMVGVHGAALTHLLFMRPGAVFTQIVPLGTNWPAKVCYESPARAMGLQYIDYRIDVEESSLVHKYGKDDIVVKDPAAKIGSNWDILMKIYLKEQDVKLDLNRFTWFLKYLMGRPRDSWRRKGSAISSTVLFFIALD